MRKDFEDKEKGTINCLAFTAPLLDFKTNGSDQADTGFLREDARWVGDYPSWLGAKDKWNTLSLIVRERKKDVPLLQMATKCKHEQLIYDEILSNFARGKSISDQRQKLIDLDENMNFPGGPADRNYESLIIRLAKEEGHKQRRLLKKPKDIKELIAQQRTGGLLAQ